MLNILNIYVCLFFFLKEQIYLRIKQNFFIPRERERVNKYEVMVMEEDSDSWNSNKIDKERSKNMNIKWSQRLRALAGLCCFCIGESEIYIHTSESSGDFITRRIFKVLFKREVF